eukprot:6214530-Pleurochrysis_carterae.AAC.2
MSTFAGLRSSWLLLCVFGAGARCHVPACACFQCGARVDALAPAVHVNPLFGAQSDQDEHAARRLSFPRDHARHRRTGASAQGASAQKTGDAHAHAHRQGATHTHARTQTASRRTRARMSTHGVQPTHKSVRTQNAPQKRAHTECATKACAHRMRHKSVRTQNAPHTRTHTDRTRRTRKHAYCVCARTCGRGGETEKRLGYKREGASKSCRGWDIIEG